MIKRMQNKWLVVMILSLLAFSCSEDDAPPKAVASFQFAGDPDDFRIINFTNFSKNAVSYSWDFGDGSALSTEENPTHTYESEGTYTVKLTATGKSGDKSVKESDVVVTDPDLALKALTGDVSKSWKLIRDVSTGHYPFEVGPAARNEIWYALGLQEELGKRPCLLSDEYIFSLDGTYEYKTNGSFWAEGGVWNTSVGAPGCLDSENSNFVNVDNVDISAWNDGTHSFEYDVQNAELTVSGLGAFIGLAKVASTEEVKVPQTAVTYKVVKLVDADVDTLIIETTLPNPGYWRFVLVHYDNPLQEPEIPGTSPSTGFTYSVNNKTVTFTNTTTGADSYSWNFGDGGSSAAASPEHTYASDGVYTVVLTATNAVGSSTSTQNITIGAVDLTLGDLTGGSTRTWKLKPVAGAFRVGPAIGSGEWFASSAADATNRACMFDDEFKFSSTFNYTYDSKGQVYAEGYMGGSNACTNDAALTGVYVGLGSNNTHTFEFIAAAGGNPVKIKVNGTGAFVGFSKGYNGGEYNGADLALQTSVTYDVVSFVNSGGVLTLDISVPINGDKTAWWSMTLVSE